MSNLSTASVQATAGRKISAWELIAPRQLERRVVVLPPPPEGWARIRFHYCGLCGSDLAQYEGRRSISYPRFIGHEFVATVEAVSPSVAGIGAGDLVLSDLNYRCGSCYQCKVG